MAQWSAAEDEQLRKLVNEYGPKRWSVIAAKLKTKGSKQCRRRWKNHLNADLKSGGWTPEEDRILMEGHRLYGNKWTEIAKMVGGRTDNAVKNRYAALCKRDSRLAQRAPAAGRGRRGRKPRPSDSDGGASDEEPEEDSDAYVEDDAKRSSSPSSESREASPVRGSKGQGASSKAESGNSSPPDGNAAVAPTGSSAGRASVLGRRRQPGTGSPPLQPEPEGAAAPKRRAVASGSGLSTKADGSGAGSGAGKQLMATPPAQVRESRPPEQPEEDAPAPRNPRAHAHQASDSSDEAEELLVTGQAYREEEQQPRDKAESSGAAGGFAAPKKLPLTINIPNAASAEPSTQPPPTTSVPCGIEIRVLKDLLSPCEIQYVRELNEMQLPLHINLDDDPSAFQARVGGRAPPGCEPPLTTSRQAAQNALAALASPGSATDFSDVLKWFQTGLTPRSTCGDETPRLTGRLGFTPRGESGLGGSVSCARGSRDGEDVGAGMLGTGLTPRCLLACSSPLGRGDGIGQSTSAPDSLVATPSRRTRRQIAVAAAVAAAEAGSQLDPLSQGGASLGSALAGFGSGGPAGTPAGLEMHAGHRQLLAKLIHSAAGVESTASGDAGGGRTCSAGPSSRPAGGGLRVVLPSPSAGDGHAEVDAGAVAGGDGANHSCPVVVTPYFTQQELLMLLEVLNSDDLQALPPPPAASSQQ